MPAPASAGPTTLVRYLVDAGFGSRRSCAALIMGGGVMVNGAEVTAITHQLAAGDTVEVAGAAVQTAEARKVYLLINKPIGYLSTVRDDRGRPTVMDLVPENLRVPGLVPAGRLDLESAGLMLLTNDGDLVHRLTHPSFGVEKEYHVVVPGPLSRDDQRRLKQGVQLGGGIAKAVSVKPVEEDAQRGLWCYAVVMVEGRKREVREMMAAVGQRVRTLVRVRIGKWRLGSMAAGSSRELPQQTARTGAARPPHQRQRSRGGRRG